jgi:AraC family transcriptional regulator
LLRTETRDQFFLVGMEYIGRNENEEVSVLWNALIPRVSEIANACEPGVFYGLCSHIEDSSDGSYSYVAGVEVSSLDDIPGGMVGRTIPRSTYAVFVHKGHLAALGATWSGIYHEWLPNAGYRPAADWAFECYDERFDAHSPLSELDVFVPIKVSELSEDGAT